ncbi:sulfotransferase [Paraburkholderia sp. J10-1]|uniref:sulfotransferase family protein n=1 Tax=Paraburkholderia sp. J10-1 TaxID=2805430 RepID=UPI002AB68B8B|nr:sulfotransferase [Paraburkholderia sp. J10-1]
MLKFPFELTFCIGAPRSGTTLLSSLLSEGPTVFPMLPECTFITRIIQYYHDLVSFSDKPRFDAYALSNEHLATILAPTIESFVYTAHSHFATLAHSHLILKDPDLSIYVDYIPFFFGDSKVVCVIRDPRDVITSFVEVRHRQSVDESVDSLISTVFNYYWRVSQSELAKQGKIHFVQFEKILTLDEQEFLALESYLGYKIGRTGFQKISFQLDTNDPTHSSNYGNPIKSNQLKQCTLNANELSRIQDAFAGYNQVYGWW